jgi:hypothetical protein
MAWSPSGDHAVRKSLSNCYQITLDKYIKNALQKIAESFRQIGIAKYPN